MPPEEEQHKSSRHRAPGRRTMRSRGAKARHSGGGCKKGSHAYGPEQPIGAGIIRLICEQCGTVSIDLREATPPVTEVPNLERRSWLMEDDSELWIWPARPRT